MTDLSLSALLESTRALHERFGVLFRVDVSERLVAEEFRELIRASALVDYLSIADVDKRREQEDLAGEAVDLFVVTLGLLQAHGVTDDDLAQAMADVIAKNDAKTSATHVLVNGKITRRELLAQPTAPGGDASSADGHEADQKGAG